MKTINDITRNIWKQKLKEVKIKIKERIKVKEETIWKMANIKRKTKQTIII